MLNKMADFCHFVVVLTEEGGRASDWERNAPVTQLCHLCVHIKNASKKLLSMNE